MSVETLKKRKDFLRVARGIKVITTTVILQAAQSLYTGFPPRIGYTTSKKIGKAVIRNRARRRLRAAVREIFPNHALSGFEYVLIGRHNTADCDFAVLQRDLKYGLEKIRGQVKQN